MDYQWALSRYYADWDKPRPESFGYVSIRQHTQAAMVHAAWPLLCSDSWAECVGTETEWE